MYLDSEGPDRTIKKNRIICRMLACDIWTGATNSAGKFKVYVIREVWRSCFIQISVDVCVYYGTNKVLNVLQNEKCCFTWTSGTACFRPYFASWKHGVSSTFRCNSALPNNWTRHRFANQSPKSKSQLLSHSCSHSVSPPGKDGCPCGAQDSGYVSTALCLDPAAQIRLGEQEECANGKLEKEKGAVMRQSQYQSPVISLIINRFQEKLWFFLNISSNLNISVTKILF